MTAHRKNSILREERCKCGHLLALLSGGGVEIKCKRCKRMHNLTLEDLAQFLKKDKEPLSSDPSGQKDAGGMKELKNFTLVPCSSS